MNAEQENEEKGKFVSMLPGTLEKLCGMEEPPQDDTILHRLLDSIKRLSQFLDEALHFCLVCLYSKH